MKSLWAESVLIPRRNSLSGNKKADVAIIGAGIAGILTAYYLTKQGKHVIVLEANQIGSGQTQNTTAKITSQHNLIYSKLIHTVGLEAARQYASANEQAVADYRQLIQSQSIACHYKELPSYLYSTSQSEPLRREADAAKLLGIKASFVSNTELPFPVHGAVRFEEQAQFHPLEFLKEISEKLIIYEDTRVLSVKGQQIYTKQGTVTAEDIIFTCHYPFINLPGLYFARMYQERSYILALEQAQALQGMYLSIDQDGLSCRNDGDIMLLGGKSHRCGKNPSGDQFHQLRETAHRLWPESREVSHWSAQDCITPDGIPYIGKFANSTPNWYVATGFHKWGMTTSMVSARLLTDFILKRKNSCQQVFSPQRWNLSASAKEELAHVLESAKGLTLGVMPGALRCPHLGCRLAWNPDEASWDCPCHGSRFNHNGELLDGPAQVDISFIE